MLDSIIDFIEERFQTIKSDPVIVAAKCFDPVTWPVNEDQVALATFGNDDIHTLKQHYYEFLTLKGFDHDLAIQEWLDLKVFGSRYLPRSYERFWEELLKQHKERFPNIALLGEIVMCFPLNTACCERGFSQMKKIKHDWRASLRPDTVDMLLRINIEGLPVAQFDARRSMEHWWQCGQRERRPMFSE